MIFAQCDELLAVNISSFDTSNVKIFQGIFYKSGKLKYLDLSNFNFSSTTNSVYMINECYDALLVDPDDNSGKAQWEIVDTTPIKSKKETVESQE